MHGKENQVPVDTVLLYFLLSLWQLQYQCLNLGGMGEPLQRELHVQCNVLYCILYKTLNSFPYIPVT